MKKQSLSALIIHITITALLSLFLLVIGIENYVRNGNFNDYIYFLMFIIPVNLIMIGFSVRTYKKTKEQNNAERKFSTPIYPDGKEVPDNTQELDRLFNRAPRAPQPEDLLGIKLAISLFVFMLIGTILAGIVFPEFLIPAYVISILLISLICWMIIFHFKTKQKIISNREFQKTIMRIRNEKDLS